MSMLIYTTRHVTVQSYYLFPEHIISAVDKGYNVTSKYIFSSRCKMENQTGRSQAEYDQQRAIEAGQHILALLNRAIPQAPREGQNLRVERPPSVESEMAGSKSFFHSFVFFLRVRCIYLAIFL
ncbi:hypothetical protein ILYODFUR_011241 [Ilyodon furcidens]|uniref:Uncharacterized protein n=1 Tax=Ilyodon furcidens TaxID=33524 RepID=A0ABV0SZ31_9TELE